MERRYFRGSRDPKNYCIQIIADQDNIEVTSTYKRIYETKKTEFINNIKNFTGNENKDAEQFKNVLLESLNESDGHVNIWYEQNTKCIKLHNNKIVPSHNFFLSTGLTLNDSIEQSLEKVYKNIISYKETDMKTIKAMTYLTFNGFFPEILIAVLHNGVIGYNKGQVFFEIFYDVRKAMDELNDIKVLNRLKIYKDHTFAVLIRENTIIIKILKKNDEIRAIIEMDKDAFGFKNFLNLTYGKKIPKNVFDVIKKAYNEDNKLGDIEIEEAEDIYDKVKETLNSRKTKFVSTIYA
ncbi:hypothetical protein BDAP_001631 [Binucleata daphniae]